MIEQLQSIDVACFSSINGLHGIFMDHAMWLVSGKLSWLLLLLAVLYVGWRKGWRTMLLLVLAIGLCWPTNFRQDLSSTWWSDPGRRTIMNSTRPSTS